MKRTPRAMASFAHGTGQWIGRCLAGAALVITFVAATGAEAASLNTPRVRLGFPGRPAVLWTYAANGAGAPIEIAPPTFNLDGKQVRAAVPRLQEVGQGQTLPNGVVERRFRGAVQGDEGLNLEIVFRVSPRSPVVRFMYRLSSSTPRQVARISDAAPLSYFDVSLASFPSATEVRLSEFVDLYHTYLPHEEPLHPHQFQSGARVMGPLVVASGAKRSVAMAYEHGSAVPNAFLEFALGANRNIRLQAVKANYGRHVIDSTHPFETLWFDLGAVAGGHDAMAAAFREFVLRDLAPHDETRRPSIFYNTWNVQERERQRGKSTYMTTMNTARILQDIDVAHAMGIEVFVIDTGWFTHTGDWEVDPKRFPDGLAQVRKRLSAHGMTLGLWFDPVMAAAASKIYTKQQANVASVAGKVRRENVWESGDSVGMCLVSDWADAFADRLIQLSRELNVNYFKLDGLQSEACDRPGHHHGDDTLTAEERLQRYAFELPGALTRIAQKVTAANPDAILDLDMTEDGRIMGLQYLTAGKYFLMNNGPYASDYNLPRGAYSNNLFFYPGPARGWMARAPLGYDRWVPSVLFLTHLFPDDPATSQMINLGTLVLGANGIWGDLQTVSRDGVSRISEVLGHYKKVRADMTETAMFRSGTLAGSPEVYEKIAAGTGRGAVVMFTTSRGKYHYVTRTKPSRTFWSSGAGVTVDFDQQGHAHIKADLKKSDTVIVFFEPPPS